mmetsp:Transcript_21219/g.50447  ORF Transcript_21219/g.50447 Transcript_21219/m.50447 type:complete len:114 (-) Transcript_21219:275-616(-)
MSLVDQRIPATANLDTPDKYTTNLEEEEDDDDDDGDGDVVANTDKRCSQRTTSSKVRISHVTGPPKVMNCTSSQDEHSGDNKCQLLRCAMTNSFGFGGTNASLLFSSWRNDDK